MSYSKEFAHKLAHCPLVSSAGIRETVTDCTAVNSPDQSNHRIPGIQIVEAAKDLPKELKIMAIDGSRWELNLDRQKHRLGYIQVGMVNMHLQQYTALSEAATVDPFSLARLVHQRQVWGLCLPSSYMRWRQCNNVKDSIRALFEDFLDQTHPANSENSLRDTLFTLASQRPGPLATGDDRFLRLHKCPNCMKGPVLVTRSTKDSTCPHCQGSLHAGDCLRIYEEANETESNENALTRMMLVLEHLTLVHQLNALAKSDPAQLACSVWYMDGPLALFGPSSWLHAPIQSRLHELNEQLHSNQFGSLIVVGMEKTGRLVRHAKTMSTQMPRRSIFPINDDYRYRHVILSRAPNRAGFGRQTHYGQDFAYRSGSGQFFVFSLPYPAPRKNSPVFDSEKVEMDQYPQIPHVVALLERLSSRRFPSAITPIQMAHQATSISRRPGGDVLTLFSKQLIGHPCH